MPEDRRNDKQTNAIWGLAASIAIQAGTGIWWASKIDTNQEQMSRQMTELKERIVYLERKTHP